MRSNIYWEQHINRNRTQLTIEPLPMPKDEWKVPDPQGKKERTMPPISLSLIPVTGPKENSPIKTLNFEHGTWKEEVEEYNALDKMKHFAEKASFDLPKSKNKQYDFTLLKAPEKKKEKENNIEKLIDSYSRISEFINGCDWSKLQAEKSDPKSLEQNYLDAKNEFMSQNLMLMPNKSPTKSVLKDVIDLSEDDEQINGIIAKKLSKGSFNIGKDGALSISVQQFKKDTYASVRHEENIKCTEIS